MSADWRPARDGWALPPALADFWAERHLLTLSTHRPDGSLHVVPVGVALDVEQECAWIITRRGSRKVRNLREGDGALAVCQVDGGRWATLEGTATVTDDAAAVARACERYAARYRQPSANPERVALRIAVRRIVGQDGLFHAAAPRTT